jgi:hypothetical protein
MTSEARPAFYALEPGSWRDYFTLVHPPYTAWHLSYVAIGAALAPTFDAGRLGATLTAFFLAVGIGAHAFDELHRRPLGTRIPSTTLAALAVLSLLGAAAIGIAGAVAIDLWLLPFVVAGLFLVPAYNLELFGGRWHNDVWFALGWGAFPVLTGYFACAEKLSAEAWLAAGFATLLSTAQRQLSKEVRLIRRRAVAVSGTLELADGTQEQLTAERLVRAPERALAALAAASVTLAIALVVLRLD